MLYGTNTALFALHHQNADSSLQQCDLKTQVLAIFGWPAKPIALTALQILGSRQLLCCPALGVRGVEIARSQDAEGGV